MKLEVPYAIGIDLGGTNIKGVVVDVTGGVLAQESYTTGDSPDSTGGDQVAPWAERIRQHIEALESRQGAQTTWVGIAAPGLASADSRSIAYMPGRLQGLEGLDWRRFLSRPQPVSVLNDAHAALLGEAWKGAASGFQNAILLTLGTGVGGAAIVDGRLLRGHIGRAGHRGIPARIPMAPSTLPGRQEALKMRSATLRCRDEAGENTLPPASS